MFLELVPECDRRNSSFQEIIFREIHWTNAAMPIFVISRGRQAARETMSDAHSRKTTVSFGPLQPIFQQGVFDKLLEQRERRAESWRRPKKGPSSAAFASQWRQPSPLAMTQHAEAFGGIRAQCKGVSPFASVGGKPCLSKKDAGRR